MGGEARCGFQGERGLDWFSGKGGERGTGNGERGGFFSIDKKGGGCSTMMMMMRELLPLLLPF